MAAQKNRVIGSMLLAISLVILTAPRAHAIYWRDDLDSALKQAAKENKPLILDFYTTWCGWCKKLDSDTYSDNRVDELSGRFICVKIDAERDADSAGRYHVNGYPTIYFLSPDGHPGATCHYVEADKLLTMMNAALKQVKAAPASAGTTQAKPAPAAAIQRKKPEDNALQNNIKALGAEFDRKTKGYYFELTGIMSDPKTPAAIINNTIVKTGDTIEGATVTQIAQRTVKLLYKQKEIVLELKH